MVEPEKNKKLKVGEMMVAAGLIDPSQLKKALEEQRKRGGKIGEIIVNLGFVSEFAFASILAKQLDIRYTETEKELVDEHVVKLIPQEMARRLTALPLYKENGKIVLAMADPLDIFALDELRGALAQDFFQVVATRSDIHRSISRHYEVTPVPESAAGPFFETPAAAGTGEPGVPSLAVADNSPAAKLVSMLIVRAIMDRASDIHINAEGMVIKIRYRIDGMLREVESFNRDMHAPIVSRIKILANMDIAEKRIPQDGRFQARIDHTAAGPVVTSVFSSRGTFRADDDATVDIRVSTLPVIQGETVVMRILSRTQIINSLEGLNFNPVMLERYRKLLARPYGMLLVTGPTGSGKSTMLYASINSLNRGENNIITVEDPVEYQIKGVNQLQVNPKAGVTFASGLRSILRQDPDIIMVGEIRDKETAEIAIHAALTGHLVFSTLHTNDAAGAAGRLVEMGIEPFLIASSIIGIAAQRLVRKVCENCKEPFTATSGLMKELNMDSLPQTLYRGKGCAACKGTGYKGRIGLFELVEMTNSIRELIISKAASSAIRTAAFREGTIGLRREGLMKAASGITTIEEVLRVTMEDAV